MEEIIKNLQRLIDGKHISNDLMASIKRMIELKIETRNSTVVQRAIDFSSAIGQLTSNELRYFRPKYEPIVVETWKNLWDFFRHNQDETILLQCDTSELMEILRLYCRQSQPAPTLDLSIADQRIDTPVSMLVSDLNEINGNAADETIFSNVINVDEGPLRNRYDAQGAFMVIRAKKWMKRHRRKWTDDAFTIINILAPNTKTNLKNGKTFRHDVSQGAIEIVRLLDKKASKMFNIEKYSSDALRKLVVDMKSDEELMRKLKSTIELATGSIYEDELIQYLANAFVIGSSSSLGKYVIRTLQNTSTSSEFVISLRSDLRVISEKGTLLNG